MIGKSCISSANYNFLKRSMLGAQSYLEIGTYDGFTIAKLAQELPEKTFVTIDDFSEGSEDHFIHNNFENENVELVKGDSHTSLLFLYEEGRRFDVIFIDGMHTYEAVAGDFAFSYPLLTGNGILAFHDCTHKEVRKAIDEGCLKLGLNLRILDNFLAWVERK